MKEASPIAASLYKMVPEQVKQYALYRTLTGEAIKMLKEGMEAVFITETLKKKYIDPLLDAPNSTTKNRTVEEPMTRDRVKGMNDFTSSPANTFTDQKNDKNTPLPFASKKSQKASRQPNIFHSGFRSSATNQQQCFSQLFKTESSEEPKRRSENHQRPDISWSSCRM